MKRAFHYYMVTSFYAGIQIKQRGKTYYITRVSAIRGTAGYEQYTEMLWKDDENVTEEENPKITYRLFRDEWKDWVSVLH